MKTQTDNQRRGHRQTVAAAQIPDARLKIQTVVELTGFSERTIWRHVAQKRFPEPIKNGTRCTRWVASDVTAWLRSRGGAST
jgi:prophage regulatory protein